MALQTELPTLRYLKAGQTAVIEDVCGCAEECQRLAALGLCCGALVRMLSPGSPCALLVGDARIMLRGSHVDAVRVSVV